MKRAREWQGAAKNNNVGDVSASVQIEARQHVLAAFSILREGRANLQKYGRTGIFVYLGLSTCVTAGFYVAIESRVDVRQLLGIKHEGEPGWFEKTFAGKGSSLALAFVCSKALVPIKLPVAAAITPYVHRVTQSLFRSGATKGN